VGVDLALEKNAVAVVNGNGVQLDRFHFPHNRGGYSYFFRRVQGIQEKHQATAFVVAMEPTNYF
jgi:transposase